jgi:hypothetical protein
VPDPTDDSTPRTRGLEVVAAAVGTALALSLGAAYVVSPGGAPQTPNHESWLDQGHTALDEVSSSVATAQLLLRLVEQGKVLGNYQQIVALDMESSAGKVSSHLSGEQPEPEDQRAFTQVTTVLSDASDLLSNVRIVLVRGDTSQYAGLAHALQTMQKKITKADGLVPS